MSYEAKEVMAEGTIELTEGEDNYKFKMNIECLVDLPTYPRVRMEN